MDRIKQISVAAIGIAIVFLAVTAVTASSKPLNTPLYTVRMERFSNEMKFSPAAMNDFAYTTENGYGLNYNVSGGSCLGAKPLSTGITNCPPECPPTEYLTCVGSTCCSTCEYTCVYTCSTCVSTCPNTCVSTCNTCSSTCNSTCVNTCRTCVSTCSDTCAATC